MVFYFISKYIFKLGLVYNLSLVGSWISLDSRTIFLGCSCHVLFDTNILPVFIFYKLYT